jgi:hypothetical protein
MTATLIATTGPDLNGTYKVHTDRYTMLIFPDYDEGFDQSFPGRTRLFVDRDLANATDPVLAKLVADEAALGDDRWIERGIVSEIDNLYDRLNAKIAEVDLRIAIDVLETLCIADVRARDGSLLVDGQFFSAVQGAAYNIHACGDGGGCRCTPGVVAGAALHLKYHMLARIDVYRPSTPDLASEIPAALLDAYTQHAIDEDGLDVSLDDAREGHHRTDTYREIARQAYAAGRASAQRQS